MFEVLRPQEMARVFLAKVDEKTVGALTLLIHKGVVIYWYTGTLRAFSSYRVNDLLVWYALEWSSEHGYHTFDFGGGGKPDEEYGVRDFKAKFGGRLVNFGRNVYVHAPLRLQASETGYRLLRRFL
jgi:lipid II:glycine glycyltransferase (peptidoglycan interpeptide bridge formation enzyme)